MAFPRNILFIIVSVIFAVGVYLLYFYLSPLIGAIVTIFLLMSIYGLTMQMFSYPVIRKFMLDPLEETESEYNAVDISENLVEQKQEEEVKWNRIEEPDESVLTSRNDVANLFNKRLDEEDFKTLEEKEDKKGEKDE